MTHPSTNDGRVCDHEGCRELVHPLAGKEPHLLHFCALHEIASYNAAELREWGEENAADMVDIARAALMQRGGILVPGVDY